MELKVFSVSKSSDPNLVDHLWEWAGKTTIHTIHCSSDLSLICLPNSNLWRQMKMNKWANTKDKGGMSLSEFGFGEFGGPVLNTANIKAFLCSLCLVAGYVVLLTGPMPLGSLLFIFRNNIWMGFMSQITSVWMQSFPPEHNTEAKWSVISVFTSVADHFN